MSKIKCKTCGKGFGNEKSLHMHHSAKHLEKSGEPSFKKPKKFGHWIIGAIFILVVSASFFVFSSSDTSAGEYDKFAQCLTENNVKMYGSYSCPPCNDQKAMFGNSWKHVDYVECSLPSSGGHQVGGGQNIICNNEGIQSYPTWEFSDGSRVLGPQTLEKLSEISNCNLNSES